MGFYLLPCLFVSWCVTCIGFIFGAGSILDVSHKYPEIVGLSKVSLQNISTFWEEERRICWPDYLGYAVSSMSVFTHYVLSRAYRLLIITPWYYKYLVKSTIITHVCVHSIISIPGQCTYMFLHVCVTRLPLLKIRNCVL